MHLNDFHQMLQTAQGAKEVDPSCIEAYVNEAIAPTELGKEQQESYELLQAGIETLEKAVEVQMQQNQADPEQ